MIGALSIIFEILNVIANVIGWLFVGVSIWMILCVAGAFAYAGIRSIVTGKKVEIWP